MFLINPEGQVQIAEYSNSPFCRPDLRIMIEGKHTALLQPCFLTCLQCCRDPLYGCVTIDILVALAHNSDSVMCDSETV